MKDSISLCVTKVPSNKGIKIVSNTLLEIRKLPMLKEQEY